MPLRSCISKASRNVGLSDTGGLEPVARVSAPEVAATVSAGRAAVRDLAHAVHRTDHQPGGVGDGFAVRESGGRLLRFDEFRPADFGMSKILIPLDPVAHGAQHATGADDVLDRRLLDPA